MMLKQLENAFVKIGYSKHLLQRQYDFADFGESGSSVGTVALAVFSGTPRSYRNACVGVVVPPSGTQDVSGFVQSHRSLGAPLVLSVNHNQIQPWSVGPSCATRVGDPFEVSEIEATFAKKSEIWGPSGIGRLRSIPERKRSHQLQLFDTGLLPVLEKFFQGRLKDLLERAFVAIADRYRQTHGSSPPLNFLVPYLFRFVAAKIFIDRGDVHGWSELTPGQLLEKAEKHAGSGLLKQLPKEFLKKDVLEHAWQSVSSNLHFQNLSVPDLAFIYESSFINKDTRKELGVHSTPEPIANYIVQRLDWSRVPVDQRVVFEPFSGHCIFLASALARMTEDLPASWSSKQRHEYLKRNLIGVEKDSLAREVARLVMTLADYPNEDGWQLHLSDVFIWPELEGTLSKATIVLANPPYESFSPAEKQAIGATRATPPAEFLHRLMKSPPALLGLVLPQSFLTSPFYQAANRQLAERYSDIQIVELPPVFQHADNETIALIAQGLRDSGNTVSVRYSDVPVHKVDDFLNDYRLFNERSAKVSVPSLDGEQFTLWLPPKGSLFNVLPNETLLGSVATIAKGIHWRTRTDGRPRTSPRGDVTSTKIKPGYRLGCEKMSGNLTQLHIAERIYLSLREEDHYERDRSFLLPWDKRKVVVNAARFERKSPWRMASYADDEGLAFTKQFFAIWPSEGVSEFALAAILSSPLANLFSYTLDLERHNHIGTLAKLPLPPLAHIKPGSVVDRLAKKTQKLIHHEAEKALINPAKIVEAIIRLDAVVLNAYGLTAHQQRQLLDQFAGWKRPLCVEFDRYFPKHFKDVITLSDFVAIQYDWDQTNERRCDLIDKEFSKTGLTSAERSELDHLQHLADLLIRLKAPYGVDGADELIQELKASGKWIE